MNRRRSPWWSRLLQTLWRRKWHAALLLLASTAWYGYETQVARADRAWMGTPENTVSDLTHLSAHVLKNPGFMLAYSEWKAAPLWVTYRLFDPGRNGYRVGKRPPFEKDPRVLRQASNRDYVHSGYTRGHMAPNYAIARLYGPEAQKATFLMSNITPQRYNLNNRWWQRLESAAIDHFVHHFREVWVVTGPIWDDTPNYLKDSPVDIPDAFYKIFIGIDFKGAPHSLAFIAPQQLRGTEPLSRYLTTIDEVERRTGLDFFWELEDGREARLESRNDPNAFQLRKVDRLPPRY